MTAPGRRLSLILSEATQAFFPVFVQFTVTDLTRRMSEAMPVGLLLSGLPNGDEQVPSIALAVEKIIE
ncbi:hypothetical protein AX760_23030 [Pararhizobium antarcticum]|uniref:Uncharacterized protein n=1 Tax=Pararhizobium antarcticum TaxID=1798805 RepID=A0A657LM59_9HYPH|nr:hypothetical protein AX760_23030 [Pararhizobium antarcticum]OJF96139.1 hypothetical protein AX761_16395 [Rhizobium sp. 58]